MTEFADDGRELVEAKTAAAWRRWLQRNGETSAGIWLILRKRPSAKELTYNQAVEESLCFGWIDSTVKTLDDERNRQYFCKRKLTSTWSRSNKDRVKRLKAEGRIAPPGQAMIDIAKANGMWTALDAIDRLEIPDDLAAAFKKNAKAKAAFDGFSPSSRKSMLWWIASAKRPETRAKRVKEVVSQAAKGIQANQ